MLVHLRDADGKPVIGAALNLDRPNGPLADRLWPHEWISDGAGLVYIPTLEACQHVLHSVAVEAPITVDVPPLPAAGPVDVSVTLDRHHALTAHQKN